MNYMLENIEKIRKGIVFDSFINYYTKCTATTKIAKNNKMCWDVG